MLKNCLTYLKNAALGISLIAAVIISSVYAPQAHNKYLRVAVGSSVVQVRVALNGGGGTGFAVKGKSGKHYIMTNQHVCAAASNKVVFVHQDDNRIPEILKIVYVDKKHDVCLIEGSKRYSPLDIGKAPKKGDFMFIVGHPGLRQLTVSSGEFIGETFVELLNDVATKEECTGRLIELDPFTAIFFGQDWVCLKKFKAYGTSAVAYGGNSGSPVTDTFGNVIGILFAGSTEQERDTYVVPVTEITRVLENH